MLYNLLTESVASSSETTPANPWGSYIMMGVLFAIIIVFMVMNRQNQKKRQQETMNMLNAIQPGNKVKTIGGICGVVVEVCPEDNTFIMETGSEASGKSYIKFDKQAVYQTDAVAKKEEIAPVEAPVEEETVVPAEEIFEEVAQEPVEVTEAPAEETVEEKVEE